ncbi:Proline iminopeptidase [Roseomonas mucosa]|uniref:prolyl aminopeptidase n=1 Tax=Roseomonas mucosa TaxID=207340 RepID=UPI0022024654|nr:prolyl aminopeptidase [Roseomonas mucosa]QDJ09472.1 Proline iminopeptidase [Roseomonas mucosa]
MSGLFPPIEPYASGHLDVGEGHRLYWECCGNPAGMPALVLHGGPGSGCPPSARRAFDPARHRIVLFDQRNCGRSTPHAGGEGIGLASNTTAHLLADIERLREHLGIGGWLLRGSSWGSTLALVYAQQHPKRVTGIVLSAVATTTRREIGWITRGVGAFFPWEWARFAAGVPEAERGGCLADAYHRLLMHPDPAIQDKAARDWCDWEMAIVVVQPGHRPHPRYQDPAFRLGFARLVTLYWRHAAWLEEGILLRRMNRLAGIPGVLIHGRLDLGSPLATAWELHRAWPGSELVVLEEAGHDGRDTGMAEAAVAAIRRVADRAPAG